jgi:cytochrome c oxidase subunit II
MKLKFLVPGLLVAVLAIALTGSRAVGAVAAPQRIAIVAKRFDFTPGEITLKKGVPVVITLTSQDVDHGLKFKELNIALKAKKGETSEVAFTPTQVGTFTGQCSVFCGSGHGSMKLTLHVTE